MRRPGLLRRLAACLVASVLLSPGAAARGGGIDYKQRRVKSLDQAGSMHVSVLSVAPWESYVDSLAPSFKLTGEQALKEVIPVTSQLDEIVQRALAMKLGLAPPTSAATSTTTFKQEGDADPTITRERTSESGPGDASGLEPPPLPPMDKSFIQDPLKARELQTDPIMRYRAANALFQEVQILNRYTADAAQRHGFIPYIVRMQVSLMPNARNEPYDAYVDLSFFCRGPETTDPEDPFTESESASVAQEGSTSRARPDPGYRFQQRHTLSGWSDVDDGDTHAPYMPEPASSLPPLPMVIPLLVTDSYEATLTQRQDEQMKQVGLALSFLLGGFGGQGGSNFFKKQYERIIANDLNSLHTVARLTDNTLRVRFGAMVQAQARYATIPSTHDISFLLLVPQDAYGELDMREIRISAHKGFQDAMKGKSLARRSSKSKDAALQAVADKFGLSEHSGCFKLLGQAVVRNDRDHFGVLIDQLAAQLATGTPDTCTTCPGTNRASSLRPKNTRGVSHAMWQVRLRNIANAIWVDLANVYVADDGLLSTFELPCIPQMTLPAGWTFIPCREKDGFPCDVPKCDHCGTVDAGPWHPAVALIDDGKARARLTMQGGNGLTPARLTGRLYISEEQDGMLLGRTELAATGIEVSLDRRDAVLTFPSPKAMGFKPDAKLRHEVLLTADPDSGIWKHERKFWSCPNETAIDRECVKACVRHVVMGDEKPEVKFKVLANPASIRESRRKGTLRLEFDEFQDGVIASFRIEGATPVFGGITTQPPDLIEGGPNVYKLKPTKSAAVIVKLDNLDPGSTFKVVVQGQGPKDKEPVAVATLPILVIE